jgi:hypothetical protein
MYEVQKLTSYYWLLTYIGTLARRYIEQQQIEQRQQQRVPEEDRILYDFSSSGHPIRSTSAARGRSPVNRLRGGRSRSRSRLVYTKFLSQVVTN